MSAKELLHENVFVEWRDLHTSVKSTLGSLCLASKQETIIKLRAESDESGVGACLYLTATVRLHSARGPRRKQIFLGIPLCAVKSLQVQKLGLDDFEEPAIARAISRAGLSNSGSVVRTTFHLNNHHGLEAFISTNTIKPCNGTGSDLLSGLKSLSTAHEFSVFASWSSYAQVSFEQLKHRLPAFIQRAHVFRCSESSRPATPLDWERVQWIAPPPPVGARFDSPPPAYPLEEDKAPRLKTRPPVVSGLARTQAVDSEFPNCDADEARHPSAVSSPDHIQVAKSPSLLWTKSPSVRDPGSVVPDSPVASVPHGAQPAAGPVVQTTSCPSSPGHGNYRKRPRQCSPSPYDFAPILNRPEGFNSWMLALKSHNIKPHSHRRLQPHLGALGQHIRTGDNHGADVERARCTALGCFDPFDDATNDELERAIDMLRQMTSLALWINKLEPYGDVQMFSALSLIGRAARDEVTLNVQNDDSDVSNRFDVLMGLCEGNALILFGRAQKCHKCAVC